MAVEFVYPPGGFVRATQYLWYRMRRLPDAPHRIARGVFAGTFVNFPPLLGIQFVSAGVLAWVMRGNILAALLCTFLSNPLTTPFIAVGSLKLGHWMLGIDRPMTFVSVVEAFTNAASEIWRNFKAIFTDAPTEWGSLGVFWHDVYLPYFVGSIIPGLIFALLGYYLTIPMLNAYQKLRRGRLREKLEKRRRLKAMQAEAQAAVTAASGDDAGKGKS